MWQELEKIEYGETISYGEIAKRIGNPKAARAVGMANNKNPIPIIIPCHRVIGKDGKMRNLIEQITKTYISIYGKTISETDERIRH